MESPTYPVTAQSNNVQGTVDVEIQVGMNGRVLSAWEGAESAGTVDHDLVSEALANARQWVWGSFPLSFKFPWYHKILYVFRLEGERTPYPRVPPIVRTHLPNQIEIIAIPSFDNGFHPTPVEPR